ncbi:hypothetical protein HDU97_002888 [Phlyctochytrium planicorne]|nr:hypothetical protein HDU97_002888 [Phlyctochytrium planicorne]
MNEIIHTVMYFLPPQMLGRFAKTCKSAPAWITYDMAINSILSQGTHTSRSRLDDLIDLAKKGAISLPTPIRMLAVCTTAICEMGLGRFDTSALAKFNPTGCSGTRGVALRKICGAVLCGYCETCLSGSMSFANLDERKSVTDDGRVAREDGKWSPCFYTSKITLMLRSTGEKVGPTFHLNDLIAAHALVNANRIESFTKALDSFSEDDFSQMLERARWVSTIRARYPASEFFTAHQIMILQKKENERTFVKREREAALKQRLDNMLTGAEPEGRADDMDGEEEDSPDIATERLETIKSTRVYRLLAGFLSSRPANIPTWYLTFIAAELRNLFAAPSPLLDNSFLQHPETCLERSIAYECGSDSVEGVLRAYYSEHMATAILASHCKLSASHALLASHNKIFVPFSLVQKVQEDLEAEYGFSLNAYSSSLIRQHAFGLVDIGDETRDLGAFWVLANEELEGNGQKVKSLCRAAGIPTTIKSNVRPLIMLARKILILRSRVVSRGIELTRLIEIISEKLERFAVTYRRWL